MSIIKKINSIPIKNLPKQTSLYKDYLTGKETLKDFYTYFPVTKQALIAQAKFLSNRQFDRKLLSEKLVSYAQRFSANATTLNNCRKLAENDACIILSGQQPGIFTGPLFTIYKAVTTIKLANMLEKELKVPVVPVFYNVSDDDDFHEIDHLNLLTHNEITTIRINNREEKKCFYDIPLKDPQKLLSLFWEIVPDKFELSSLISPTPEDTLATWFSRMMFKLFAQWGLVIYEPYLFRDCQAAIITKEINHPGESNRIIASQGAKLKQKGYEQQIIKKDNAPNFFQLENNCRLKITTSSAYRGDPSQVSLALPLRPSWQHRLLPVLAHVCGPGEIAYYAQLMPLQSWFDTYMPVIFPRQTYTFIEHKIVKVLQRWQLGESKLFYDKISLEKCIPVSSELSALLAHARAKLQDEFAQLQPHINAINKDLNKNLQKTKENILNTYDKFSQKVNQAWQDQQNLGRQNMELLRHNILPKNKLQERVLNIFPYLAKYGVELIDELITSCDPFDFEHKLVYL